MPKSKTGKGRFKHGIKPKFTGHKFTCAQPRGKERKGKDQAHRKTKIYSLKSLISIVEDPRQRSDIGASLAQSVARQSHNPALAVHVRYLKIVSSTLTRGIYLFNHPKALNAHEMKVKIRQASPS